MSTCTVQSDIRPISVLDMNFCGYRRILGSYFRDNYTSKDLVCGSGIMHTEL
jgi:hypothetical protein